MHVTSRFNIQQVSVLFALILFTVVSAKLFLYYYELLQMLNNQNNMAQAFFYTNTNKILSVGRMKPTLLLAKYQRLLA